jgi:hypothetical protein
MTDIADTEAAVFTEAMEFSSAVTVKRISGRWEVVEPGPDDVIHTWMLTDADARPGVIGADRQPVPWFLLGGHRHEVSRETAAELARDGFGAGLRAMPPPKPTKVRGGETIRDTAWLVGRNAELEARVATLEARLDALTAPVTRDS